MKQREKPARRQGHPCLLFVHDIALQASAVIPDFPSFVTFTINCMFLNSLIYIRVISGHLHMDACSNVKNQLVGKAIRAYGSFMTL